MSKNLIDVYETIRFTNPEYITEEDLPHVIISATEDGKLLIEKTEGVIVTVVS